MPRSHPSLPHSASLPRKRRRAAAYALVAILPAALQACGRATPDAPTVLAAEYAPVAEALRGFIEREMAHKGLPALSIALVRDQETIWAEGFGSRDLEGRVPATARTVYRVGSVSKLFTDIAVMDGVARGDLDLDAPVRTYLPDFAPANPFAGDVTLRQLMSHRSGLVREPPVGNYFDPSEPTLAATIASLNTTALVYEPRTRIKYSNAAIATVGYVLERTYSTPFVEYVETAVLEPLGLSHSSFAPTSRVAEGLAEAQMWTVDGRTSPAPTFQLGMAPAGSMYSTVTELAGFMSALFAVAQGETRGPLTPSILDEMWTPQFADTFATSGFGIGFHLGRLDGHRRVGHGGAIYGFSTELAALPDEGLGVVVVTSKDMANAVMERIADTALRLLLAATHGQPLPPIDLPRPLPDGVASRLAGSYQGSDRRVAFLNRDGRALLELDGIPFEVLATGRGDTLVVDDLIRYGPLIVPGDDVVEIGGREYGRVEATLPPPPPSRWDGLIGEYGWDHNILYILEREGRLHALIEWFFLYPLEEISTTEFRFPDYGLYDGERLVFSRDAAGMAASVEAASVTFMRRQVGTPEGETFRIDPVRPVNELRAEALRAEPPTESGTFREADLVDLSTLDPTIRFDIRYATTNNFMSSVFYTTPRAFLQRPAAEALVRAHRALASLGYGLLVFDAYRPWYVTRTFWDATPEEMRLFVADPSQGSRHNRGAAVDLTLYRLETGEPVAAVGGYDEFSPRSFPDYPGGTARQRWHRELLREVMEEEGFRVYEAEWWHFDYQDWRDYQIQNRTFEELLEDPEL